MKKDLLKASHKNEQKEHSGKSGAACACICTEQTPLVRASTGCFFNRLFMFIDKKLLETICLILLVFVIIYLWILFWLFIMVLCGHGIDIFTENSIRDKFLYGVSFLGLIMGCMLLMAIIFPVCNKFIRS